MSTVPYTYPFQTEYANNYTSFPLTSEATSPTSAPASTVTASAMSQINWQSSYPSQIAPVNTAMSTLFPPYSRGSSQKVIFTFFYTDFNRAKTLG